MNIRRGVRVKNEEREKEDTREDKTTVEFSEERGLEIVSWVFVGGPLR